MLLTLHAQNTTEERKAAEERKGRVPLKRYPAVARITVVELRASSKTAAYSTTWFSVRCLSIRAAWELSWNLGPGHMAKSLTVLPHCSTDS